MTSRHNFLMKLKDTFEGLNVDSGYLTTVKKVYLAQAIGDTKNLPVLFFNEAAEHPQVLHQRDDSRHLRIRYVVMGAIHSTDESLKKAHEFLEDTAKLLDKLLMEEVGSRKFFYISPGVVPVPEGDGSHEHFILEFEVEREVVYDNY